MESVLNHPVQHHGRLTQPRFRCDAFTERPVDRHEKPLADELVQLEQVDVFRVAEQGRVEDDKQLAGVSVHHREMGTFHAFLDGQGMEAEAIPQQIGSNSITLRDVHPHETVRPIEQLGKVGGRVVFHSLRGDVANLCHRPLLPVTPFDRSLGARGSDARLNST